MQLGQLRDSLSTLEELGAKVIAVDPHESWSAKYLLKDAGASAEDIYIPVLMDPSLTASASYGVAFQMRIHTEISNRPATFVIDRQGVIRYQRRAETFNDRPKPREILGIVRDLE